MSGDQDSVPGWCIASTGRNWRCRWGWLAPLSSPELKKAKRRLELVLLELRTVGFVEEGLAPQARRHSYVASRSAVSRRSVCAFQAFVARMK